MKNPRKPRSPPERKSFAEAFPTIAPIILDLEQVKPEDIQVLRDYLRTDSTPTKYPEFSKWANAHKRLIMENDSLFNGEYATRVYVDGKLEQLERMDNSVMEVFKVNFKAMNDKYRQLLNDHADFVKQLESQRKLLKELAGYQQVIKQLPSIDEIMNDSRTKNIAASLKGHYDAGYDQAMRDIQERLFKEIKKSPNTSHNED